MSTVVVSLVSLPVCASMAIAWVSSASAWKTKELATLLFHRLRCAMLAVVLNEARLLCCSESAELSAVCSLGRSWPTSRP